MIHRSLFCLSFGPAELTCFTRPGPEATIARTTQGTTLRNREKSTESRSISLLTSRTWSSRRRVLPGEKVCQDILSSMVLILNATGAMSALLATAAIKQRVFSRCTCPEYRTLSWRTTFSSIKVTCTKKSQESTRCVFLVDAFF
jgi:hypothetical protein